MTPKLLVVDGSNLLFQMFYGMPARIVGKDGKPIQGIVGFVGALLKIIKITSPTHVVALFDGECSNFRKEIDGEYKANRPDFSQMAEEETPFSQLPHIYDALDALGIKRAATEACEADDWVATYALRYGKELEVVIASFDSDFFQLITDKVSVLRYRGEKTLLCTPEYVAERYGVSPSEYADFKAFIGDKADNVKGVKGIGEKRAAALVKRFGGVEGALENLSSIVPPSVRKAVEEGKERLKTSLRLIRLTEGEALPFFLENLAFSYRGQRTGEVLRKIGVTD